LFTSKSQTADYQLIDFGRGRKLERFDGRLLDRPCPAADGIPQATPKSWSKATHRVVDKRWETNEVEFSSDAEGAATQNVAGEIVDAASPKLAGSRSWCFRWNDLSLSLKTSPFGHVGVFPEQVENWDWLSMLGKKHIRKGTEDTPPNALNLFAYTGGSTLALASAGFAVTHVDASKPSVQWARSNAESSRLSHLPIRWIVDDVRDFVQREVRRKNRYDVIVLDPPAFGHGANGKRWELDRDLGSLISDCCSLLTDHPIAMLLTGHSPISSMEYGPLEKPVFKSVSSHFASVDSKRASLIDLKGRELDCGYIFRWFN
jgi:23S rRNA (cytosine1962-C5)-methyltransferase